MSEALLFGSLCYLIYKEEIYIESEFKLCRLFFFFEKTGTNFRRSCSTPIVIFLFNNWITYNKKWELYF